MIGDVDDDSITQTTLLLLLLLPPNAHYLSMLLPAYMFAPFPSLHPCQHMLLPALSSPCSLLAASSSSLHGSMFFHHFLMIEQVFLPKGLSDLEPGVIRT